MKTTRFKDAFTTHAKNLTDNQSIKVVFAGKTAKTDGKTLIIPELADNAIITDEQAAVFRGYRDHEELHPIMSDFSIIKSIQDGNLRDLFNVAEDYSIEHHAPKSYPGMALTIGALDRALWDQADTSRMSGSDFKLNVRNCLWSMNVTDVGGIKVDLTNHFPADVVAEAAKLRDKILAVPRGCQSGRILSKRAKDGCKTIFGIVAEWFQSVQQPQPNQPEPQQPQDESDQSDPGQHDEDQQDGDQSDGGDQQDDSQDNPKGQDQQDGSDQGDGQDGDSQDSSQDADGDNSDQGGDTSGNDGGAKDDQHKGVDSDTLREQLINSLASRVNGDDDPESMVTKLRNGKRITFGSPASAFDRWFVYPETFDVSGMTRDEAKCYAISGGESPFYHPRINADQMVFDRIAGSIRNQVAMIKRNLEVALMSAANRDRLPFQTTGRIDPRRLANAIVDQDTRVFTKRSDGIDSDTLVTILVDNSGSMRQNERNIEAVKLSTALIMACERIGFKSEVIGFQAMTTNRAIDNMIESTPIELTRNWIRFKPDLLVTFKQASKTLAQSQAGLGCLARTCHGWTPTLSSMVKVIDHMSMSQCKRKILILITDGDPDLITLGNDGFFFDAHFESSMARLRNQGVSNIDYTQQAEIYNYVRAYSSTMGIELVPIGIDIKNLTSIFPDAVIVGSDTMYRQAMTALTKLITRQVKHVNKSKAA